MPASGGGAHDEGRWEHVMINGIWEFAHPGAMALGVGLAVLLGAISVEALALWNATHQHS